MRNLVVELEDEIMERLERIVPGESRQQSAFVAMAIRKALWDLEERRTAQAYARQPDSADDAYVDADTWEG